MITKRRKLPANETIVVPKKYTGQWIVWNRNRTQILGSGENLKELQAAALAAGENEPAYEWVPPANRRIVGPVPCQNRSF